MRRCSNNYSKESWILQLDISWYFMWISKEKLFWMVKKFLEKRFLDENLIKKFSEKKIFKLYEKYFDDNFFEENFKEFLKWKKFNKNFYFDDKNFLEKFKILFLKNKIKREKILNFLLTNLEKIIFNNPRKNCNPKSHKNAWNQLPKSKSLFYSKPWYWLPIWNLTSQLFWNVYLDKLDKFIKNNLKIKFYWRYVDDMILIHNSKEKLQECEQEIKIFLKNNLNLEISDKKTKLKKFQDWVDFLWAIIKPHRIYVRNRTKWNFYKKIYKFNKKEKKFSEELRKYDKNQNLVISDFSIAPDFPAIPAKAGIQDENLENRKKNHKIFLQEVEDSVNSYLWILRQFDSYKLRSKILNTISPKLRKFFTFYKNQKLKISKFTKLEILSKKPSSKKIHIKNLKLSATIPKPFWENSDNKGKTFFIETWWKKYHVTTK